MIGAEHIHFAYGHKAALQDVSFTLKRGSLCGVLGANGSGKTTLLKCLLGILPVQKGSVQIDGRDLHALRPGRRARFAAYVPQDTRQYSMSTVFENLLLGRKPYFGASPTRRDIQIVSEVLAELHLENLAMQPVHTLSGGQRQRVCIAKALCQQTPVILLDEPTANLDVRFKIEVMHVLENLASQGKTILFTVHDLSIPRAFCSDVILLKDGKKLAQGGREILNERNIEELYDVDYGQLRPLIAPGRTAFSPSPSADTRKVLSLCRDVSISN